MKGMAFGAIMVVAITLAACIQAHDTCDDVAGFRTHTITEITGIESVSVSQRNTDTDAIEAIDPATGADFSNVVIDLDLSWTAEEHRFRANNTFITSFLDWVIPTASACSLAPVADGFEPRVASLTIFSDSDFNQELISGSDLSAIFNITPSEVIEQPYAFSEEDADEFSARAYALTPAYADGGLVATPETSVSHIFTIMLNLEDGRTFEVRTNDVLISGV